MAIAIRSQTNVAAICLLWMVICVFPAGCKESKSTSSGSATSGGAVNDATQREPVVYTTFHPMTYFTQRIGGDAIEVICPLPTDADPIHWNPNAETVTAYQSADLIIANGAVFEKWMLTAVLPASRIIETAFELPGGFIEYATTTHTHGMNGDHTHDGIDGHTWVAPTLAIHQAKAILHALQSRWPRHANEFEANFHELVQDLRELHSSLMQLTKQVEQVELWASHPAYNYLARELKWSIHNLDVDPAQSLSEEEMVDVQERVASANATLAPSRRRILLWEAEPTSELKATLTAALGFEHVVFEPVEHASINADGLPSATDYLQRMQANVERLRTELQQ